MGGVLEVVEEEAVSEWGTLIRGKPFSVLPTAFALSCLNISSAPRLLHKKLVRR